MDVLNEHIQQPGYTYCQHDITYHVPCM